MNSYHIKIEISGRGDQGQNFSIMNTKEIDEDHPDIGDCFTSSLVSCLAGLDYQVPRLSLILANSIIMLAEGDSLLPNRSNDLSKLQEAEDAFYEAACRLCEEFGNIDKRSKSDDSNTKKERRETGSQNLH